MFELHTSPAQLSAPLANDLSVLLALGTSDDALYYQARLGPWLSHRRYLVYFHAGAQMLERLRLHGSLAVSIWSLDSCGFDGYLTLAQSSASEQSRIAAILQIGEAKESRDVSPKCVLHT